MQLRHIRPRSMEWYDAMVANRVRAADNTETGELLSFAAPEEEEVEESSETPGRVRHARERLGYRF